MLFIQLFIQLFLPMNDVYWEKKKTHPESLLSCCIVCLFSFCVCPGSTALFQLFTTFRSPAVFNVKIPSTYSTLLSNFDVSSFLFSSLSLSLQIPNEGSLVLVIFLMVLEGVTGISLGLVISSAIDDEQSALQATLGLFQPNLLLSGKQ